MQNNEQLRHQAEQIVAKYGGNATGIDSWMIHCPVPDHEDRNPSCSVSVKDDRLLVYCHVCGKDAYKALIASGDISIASSYKNIWDAAHVDGFEFDLYLESRGLQDIPLPDSFRVHTEITHPETDDTEQIALIGAVTNVEGTQVGIHRTYLDGGCEGKLEVSRPKLMLGSIKGGHVRLTGYTDISTIHLSEGIETGFAIVGALGNDSGVSVWATMSATNLSAIQIPDETKKIHIWADYDRSKTGIKAAVKLAQRLYDSGKTVFIHHPDHVDFGDGKSIDWLDEKDHIVESLKSVKAFSPNYWDENGAITPDAYDITEKGVTTVNAKGKKIWVSTAPIWMSEAVQDLESHDAIIFIKYRDKVTKSIHTISFPRELLYSDSIINKLGRQPRFPVSPSMIGGFRKYLYACDQFCTSQRYTTKTAGWKEIAGKKFFVPACDNQIELTPVGSGSQQRASALHAEGDFDLWTDIVFSQLSKNPLAAVAFMAVLSAPLLKPLSLKSFVVDMYGLSSQGKTITGKIATSIFGDPEVLKISWDSTHVALEQNAALLNDHPVFLDESQSVKKESLVFATVYGLANGIGRERGQIDGGTRVTGKWLIVVFSTGERSLLSFPGVNFDGFLARILSLHGRPLGNSSEDEVRQIEGIVCGHFGLLGPLFVESIVQYADKLQGWFEQHRTDLLTGLDVPNVILRKCDYFAVMLTSLDLLKRIYGTVMKPELPDSIQVKMESTNKILSEVLTTEEEGTVAFAAAEALERLDSRQWRMGGQLAKLSNYVVSQWHQTIREHRTEDSGTFVLNKLMSWYHTNKKSFVASTAKTDDDIPYKINGIHWNNCLAFFPTAFDDFVKGLGLDARNAKDVFKSRGWLYLTGTKRGYQHQIRFFEKPTNFIVLSEIAIKAYEDGCQSKEYKVTSEKDDMSLAA